jgi:predicted nucleic acid-binding protein
VVLESAIEGRAEFVVSGDKDLLCLGTFRGIRIVRAS